MEALLAAMQELVVANRILATEGVCDAFGHASVRHPDKPDRYVMARSRSPGVITIDDLMEYTLDGDPIDDRGRFPYAERFIHGAIFEQRPDIHSVVHNHSHAVIPFGVTKVPLRPIVHVGAAIGSNIPVWDIRDKFGETNLLVVNMEQGRDLANCLGENKVALMRGHGCVVAGNNHQNSVMTSVYLQVAATLQQQAMAMGEVHYLSDEEIKHCADTFAGEMSVARAWQYLKNRAGMNDM